MVSGGIKAASSMYTAYKLEVHQVLLRLHPFGCVSSRGILEMFNHRYRIHTHSSEPPRLR